MNKFTIHYPNGMKRHVKKAEILLLGNALQQTAPHEYLATHLQQNIEQASGPSFLAGRFIFEHKGKKRLELMQSVQGLVRQMEASTRAA